MAIRNFRFLRDQLDLDETGKTAGQAIVVAGDGITYELDTVSGGGGGVPSGPAGGVLGGTYPNPSFASDMATQAELDAIAAGAVILAPASSARNVIQPTAGSVIAAIVKAHAAQSVDLMRWVTSADAVLFSIGQTGTVKLQPSADVHGLIIVPITDSYANDTQPLRLEFPGNPTAPPAVALRTYNIQDFWGGPTVTFTGKTVASSVPDRDMGYITVSNVQGLNMYGMIQIDGSGIVTASNTPDGFPSFLVEDNDFEPLWMVEKAWILAKEMTDPAAPATNFAYIYPRDNGSGLTQWCVRFPTGSPYVLATEGDGAIYRASGTDVAVADGGTGASTASGARTNLGLVIGTDVEAHDTDLTTIAGLSPSNDDVVQRKAGAWANRTIAQLLTDLAAPGTTFQPLDSDLTALAGLTSAADKLPYFTGSGSAGVADFTAAARSLLDDSTAAAMLVTLGAQAALITTNVQTASYTLVLGDAGLLVEMNVASANNLTVPTNASVAFPVGTVIAIHQYGAGQTTVVASGGVTIRSPGGKLKLTGQYSSGALRKRATDEWVLTGDITT